MADKWNAWVWVRWKTGTSAQAWETWKDHPKIKSAWSTHGDWDCCLWVNVSDHEALEEFVWKTLRHNEWVESTRTMWAKQWW
ncbi:MAG: Lrp/AsnC ligand binding domain-containing protein [Deltaproteobacteria bacterium]|nr:Lrp/AsnC ligand binding domain-containing protein [Deltaproteobacteria bacterium]